MKKGIRVSAINNVAKKAALGAMLAGSVAGYATNPVKTFAENPNHTEVVSNKGAEALKALAYPMLQQQKQSVPTTHNKALDEKLLKFCDNDKEKKDINDFLLNLYNKNGSYYASAIIQQYLDLNIFLEFLDGNTEILKRFDENAYNKIDKEAMKKVTAKSEPIKQWLNENYFNVYNEPFGQFDHPPDAEEVSNVLDKYVDDDPYDLFYKVQFYGNYTNHNKSFRETQNKYNVPTPQKESDYIANQVLRADYMLFMNLLIKFGVDVDYEIKTVDGKQTLVSVQSNLLDFISVCKPNPKGK